MMTLKTKVLVFLTIGCGLGIGILAPFHDGLYSAMLLFIFPFLSAFMAVGIGIDLNRSAVDAPKPVARERRRVRLSTQMRLVSSNRIN